MGGVPATEANRADHRSSGSGGARVHVASESSGSDRRNTTTNGGGSGSGHGDVNGASGILCVSCGVSVTTGSWEVHIGGTQHLRATGQDFGDCSAAISRLMELSQTGRIKLTYDDKAGRHGPDHCPEHVVRFILTRPAPASWSETFDGQARNKKRAKGIAAQRA